MLAIRSDGVKVERSLDSMPLMAGENVGSGRVMAAFVLL